MANSIKYSQGSESLALSKGNWWIGTGDVDKGPTSESGYWNTIDPPTDGYVVYLNKETNGPSIHSINSDENLISFTNKISGQNYTTVAECLVYYQTQDDKICVNREYENIVTDGLVFIIDSDVVYSHPKTGNTWYDLSSNKIQPILTNSPLLTEDGVSLDGTNDSIDFNPQNFENNESFTLEGVVVIPDFYHLSSERVNWMSGQGGNSMVIIYKDGLGIWNESGGLNFTKLYFNSEIQDNIPYHIVLTRNTSNEVKLYLDGVLQDIKERDGQFRWVFMGKLGSGTQYASKLIIRNVKIYNRDLTADEVYHNFDVQNKRYKNFFTNGEFKSGIYNYSSLYANLNTGTTLPNRSYSLELPPTRGGYQSNNIVPIDVNYTYSFNIKIRTLVKGGPNSDVLSSSLTGFACYDKFNNFIDRRNCGGRVDTVLTRDLNAGDEYAYVSSENNGIDWYPGDSQYFFKHFIIFPPEHPHYSNPWYWTRIGFGEYNIYYSEITDIGGGELRIKFSDLNNNPQTFPNIGYETPAGTPVSNGSAGGTYNYVTSLQNIPDNEWLDVLRENITGEGLSADTQFRPGTKGIKFMILNNWNTPSNTNPFPIPLIGELKFLKQ